MATSAKPKYKDRTGGVPVCSSGRITPEIKSGIIFAITLALVTGCLPISDTAQDSSGKNSGVAEAEAFTFDPEYAKALFSPVSIDLVPPRFTVSEWEYVPLDPDRPLVTDCQFYFEHDKRYNSAFVLTGTPGAHTYVIDAPIEDTFGSYARVLATLRDEYVEAIPLLYSHNMDDPSVDPPSGRGSENIPKLADNPEPIGEFTEDEMRQAIRLVSDFLLNESVDSIALDDISRYPEWIEEVAPRYFTEVFASEALASYQNSAVNYLVGNEWFESRGLVDLVPEESIELNRLTPGLVFMGSTPRNILFDEGSGSFWDSPRPLLRDGGSRVGNKHVYGFRFHKQVFDNLENNRIVISVKTHARFFYSADVDYVASGSADIDRELFTDASAAVPTGIFSLPYTISSEIQLILTNQGWKIADLIQDESPWSGGLSFYCESPNYFLDENGDYVFDEAGNAYYVDEAGNRFTEADRPIGVWPDGFEGNMYQIVPEDEIYSIDRYSNYPGRLDILASWVDLGTVTEEDIAQYGNLMDQLRYVDLTAK